MLLTLHPLLTGLRFGFTPLPTTVILFSLVLFGLPFCVAICPATSSLSYALRYIKCVLLALFNLPPAFLCPQN